MRMKDEGLTLEMIPPLPTPLRTDIQLYVQVYDVLYALICSGEARPGDLIPGENALAAHFGVSRGTIRQAMQYLEEDGLLIKHQGRGSEVADRSNRQNGGLQSFDDVCRAYCTVPIDHVDAKWNYTGAGSWFSEQLQLAKGALVVVSELTFYSGGESVALSQRLFPSAWLERCAIDPNDEEEMRRFVLEGLPQLVARSRTEIMVQTQELPEVARSGEIPYFSISEITYDAQERPVAHFKNYLRSDCYHLYIGRRQGPR